MSGFNHERLTEIRIARGMTMEQLATTLGISKQMISKYEDGKSMPQIDAISKMAELFSVPNKYLFKDSVVRSSSSSTLFLRARLDTTKRTRTQARIISGWGYEISNAVDNVQSLISSLSMDDNLTIPEKAMELRRRWGLGTQPIKNMVSLLELQGFNVFSVDLPGVKTEAYSQMINGTPVIVVNREFGTSVRQRFSLAHELGHMVLHGNLGDWEFDLRNKEIENQAHQFAEYFLLPIGGFDASFISPKMDTFIAMKKEWLVSIGAMVFHAGSIGLIDSNQKNLLQRQINARGWQKSEPLDDDIAHEKPSAVGNRILSKVTDQNTFVEFFDEVRLPIDSIEDMCAMSSGSLMQYYDSSFESIGDTKSNQQAYEQLTLFNLGGDYRA